MESNAAREDRENGALPFDPNAAFPDSVVEFCIVPDGLADGSLADGSPDGEPHRNALRHACRTLFASDKYGMSWQYDVGKARRIRLDADALFAPADRNSALNYRKAFLYPPHGTAYTDADFDRLNAALFPNGTDALEVCAWSTDWSDYFDDGHEWWGALCLTVRDNSAGRFVVILASATD